MKANVMSVLLCLLSALLVVQSQTVPYISFMGTSLSNNSYINLTLVGDAGDGSDSVQCHTDLISCCNATQGVDRGDWYFPEGMRLQFSLDIPFGVFQSRQARRVDLRYRGQSDTHEGMYRCDIETSTTSNNNRETVYVGLYASGGEYLYTHMYTL